MVLRRRSKKWFQMKWRDNNQEQRKERVERLKGVRESDYKIKATSSNLTEGGWGDPVGNRI